LATTYRFGAVEVRPAERQVLVEGKPAALGARAFDLLLALIDGRDRVVGKSELLDRVWPGVIVEENNLQVQVSTLRKILGAQAVATIPGRGYRFTLLPEGSDAPPSCPLPARSHNLPAALDTFIGREDEIREIKALLGAARLVTLIGAGGTGKTRLSLQVAAEVLDEFPDGVWLTELAPLSDERHLPLTVATALGVKEETLLDHVKGRRLLVILDNCEHLLHGCAAIAGRLLRAAPGVRVLASSRETLHVGGEVTYRVPTLASAQAVRLFVDRAKSASPAFEASPENAQTLAEICRRLDSMPLAIELAAARVRALSVAKIAERLDDCFRLLTGGDQTTLPRQQTLRASIDWSHDLLSAPEQVLLRRLAVFKGGWTLEAAEAVGAGCEGGPSTSVLQLLTELVEKSLVAIDAEGARYRLLETVRQYALERLEASGEAADIRNRHLRYFLELAGKARTELVGPDQAVWMAWLDNERDNLLAAHAWCGRVDGGAELGLRLVIAIKQYWINRGMVGLARGVVLDALAHAPQRDRNRARALFVSGQTGYFLGLYREARRELEEGLAIARELGDKVVMGQVLQPLGMSCVGEADLVAARAHLDEALALAREQGDPRNVAAAVNALAQLHRVKGDLDAAEPLFGHVLDLARQLGDRESIAIGQLNLAMTSIDRRLADDARSMLREALAFAEETGSKPVGQSVLEVCAGLAALQERWDFAARFYGAAEAEASHTGIRRDPADEAFLKPRVAKSRATLGAAFEAAEKAGRALPYDVALREARAWLHEVPVTTG
jgi:non-specific serine/threonine protein kinase